MNCDKRASDIRLSKDVRKLCDEVRRTSDTKHQPSKGLALTQWASPQRHPANVIHVGHAHSPLLIETAA